MKTDYYIVAVDEDGDVMAVRADLVDRTGLDIKVKSQTTGDENTAESLLVAFENQGDDSVSKWESAHDALAAVMPDEDEFLDDEDKEAT